MPWKVKLHLFGEPDYTKFLELMTPYILKTETLDNYYLDGDYQELYALGMMARVRWIYCDDSLKSCSLQLRTNTLDVPRVREEEVLSLEKARRLISGQPIEGEVRSHILNYLLDNYTPRLRCIGGFKSIRRSLLWNGAMVELDEDFLPGGIAYQLQYILDPLDNSFTSVVLEFLAVNNIVYTVSTKSKFALFVDRVLCHESQFLPVACQDTAMSTGLPTSACPLIEPGGTSAETTLETFLEDIEDLEDGNESPKSCRALCITRNGDLKCIGNENPQQRSRNCMASARYRRKKQQEFEQLQQICAQLRSDLHKAKKLIRRLETENKKLKEGHVVKTEEVSLAQESSSAKAPTIT